MSARRSHESALAEDIVSVLERVVQRVCSEPGEAIRYTIHDTYLRLRSIVLSRQSLRRLLADPIGLVKIEYLKRDLLRRAVVAAEYRYPRSWVRS